ncbi:MAG: hypothetical protein IJD25_01350 [Alphaproteobacteria bacterium]|nr:hypothetical protein [Alphaproteobacteria bacterium]
MTTIEKDEKLIQTIKENLNLSQKQAEKFLNQARELQKNIQLRKKQKEEREKNK